MESLPTVPLRSAFAANVLCGLTTHLLFNRFHEGSLRLLLRILVGFPLLPATLLLPHIKSKVSAIGLGYLTTYAAISVSIILYRLSPFHPLAKYPGPLLARITKFWGMRQTHSGKAHLVFLKLHRKYGPVVRTGPNELSVCDTEGSKVVLGNNGLPKGPIWEGRRSPKSTAYALIAIRDVPTHLKRRKIWNKAFNVAAVKDYETILVNRIDQLVETLKTKPERSADSGWGGIDLAELISFFSYDVMGDLGFGGGFELMRDGDTQGVWPIMEGGIKVQAYTQHVPWASPFLYSLPGMGKAARKLIGFVIRLSKQRIKQGGGLTVKDLSYHLLDEGSPSPQPLSLPDYSSDAFLAVVAGSDTAATVLSCTFFYLLTQHGLYDRLRKELDDAFPPASGNGPMSDTTKLGELELLNAVINESLRLQPPVPTSLQRTPEPGSGGARFGSTFIPEGTGVYVPPYAMHRDPRYFSPKPDEFIPERWMGKGDYTTNQDAFIPYSIGPMNCAGKRMAQLELRAVVATLVQKFDMRLRAGWDTREWEQKLEDWFVFKKGVLPVEVRVRV